MVLLNVGDLQVLQHHGAVAVHSYQVPVVVIILTKQGQLVA